VNLIELDLYDNKLTKIENIGHLINLKTLDVSFNGIKVMEGFEGLTSLTRLYLVSNRFRVIQNLNPLVNLEVLDIGDNKIKTFDGIQDVSQIKELYLASNKVKGLDGNLLTLTNLRILGA
jgi:protein phosphatase 1 regulatory subunit 7